MDTAMKRLLLSILIVLCAGQAWGASTTYYVSPTNNGANCTSWADTCASIAAALVKSNAVDPTDDPNTAVGAGHIIYVAPGTYTDYPLITDTDMKGGSVIGTAAHGSTAVAAADQVIINVQAGNHGFYINQPNFTLKGLTIKGAPAGKNNLFVNGVDGLVIQQNHFENGTQSNVYIDDCTNFVFTENSLRGVAAKDRTLDIRSGTSSGIIAHNRFLPSSKYSSGYVWFEHTGGTIGFYNNDLVGSYAYAVYQTGAGGTVNAFNNRVWGNGATSYSQQQAASTAAFYITAGTFNYDYNLILGSGLKQTGAVSGGSDGGHNLTVDGYVPKTVGRNFGSGHVAFTMDDNNLSAMETYCGIIHNYGGHCTLYVTQFIKGQSNYQARLQALIAAGHAVEAHSYSHTDFGTNGDNANFPVVFTIKYVGTDVGTPHIAITSGDSTGSIVLTTTEGNDNVTYNFTATSKITDFIASSSGKVVLGDSGGKWRILNMGETAPASPYYSTAALHCTSLDAIDADLAGDPLIASISVRDEDETTGFYKDELVDWKAELEGITGASVTTFATPRAVTYPAGVYALIESAGYDGARGDIDIAGGNAFVDLRQINPYRIATIAGADLITNSSATEAAVRAQARRLAGYVLDNPVLVAPVWHAIDDEILTSAQLGYFCDELQKAGVSMATVPSVVASIRATGSGWTDESGIWTNLTLPVAASHAPVAGSPAINAGTPVTGLHDVPCTDFEGRNCRDSNPDIGAYNSLQNVILGSGPAWTISGGGSLWTLQ